jgi:hypothetical protein
LENSKWLLGLFIFVVVGLKPQALHSEASKCLTVQPHPSSSLIVLDYVLYLKHLVNIRLFSIVETTGQTSYDPVLFCTETQLG